MKTKNFFLILYFGLFSFSTFAQTYMESAETTVLEALQQVRSNEEGIDRQKAANHFEATLKTVLSKEKSWTYSFPELRKYINIETSRDKKIRTFSWDSRLGGSWHALRSLIQFKTDTKIHVLSFQDEKPIDEEEEGNDMFADAVILGIYPFEKGYLFEGFGTYGSGHHHKIVAYFELIDEKLVRKAIFENNEFIYVFKIPRKYDFDLKINVEEKTITHSEFVLDDDIGFFLPTGKKVLLTFDGKQFVKQLKKQKP
ncbi:hypothetical protein U8527_02295 [Kordia algicida OT-1]|uniref:Uncharacterized protein n=1 Tax=Kordia algicida OT-1 TaxID=391587 RepID=A9DN96_9FLAO|nr:hypothetical protein [Kordia algicida]EDP97141.1 hypothetical protein KAOT1_18302 [Kordia algicida OT-1]